MGDQISLGAYIFRRIHDLGINHIFGVPGDFNLNLLDHLYTVPGLSWVGNCNELNGAYAADGYARTRGLPGVLVTTFGVGELSALNGIGGAYSEYVPIIHIVGTTARFAQDRRLMIHHTLEEGWDHTTLQRVPTPMSTATCFLAHDDTFTQEVDRVIETCVKTRRPAYMYVPMDVPDLLVDGRRLQTPLDLTITNPGSEDLEDSIVDKIVSRLERAARPCFLVDALAQRFGLTADLRELVRLTGLPAFVTPLGKSIIDETSENFAGLYMGAVTPSAQVKAAVESSDLVIHAGRFPTDTNTAGWSQKLQSAAVLHPSYVSLGEERWDSVSFVPVVKKLLLRVRSAKPAWKHQDGNWWKPAPKSNIAGDAVSKGTLDQANIWKVFNQFLKKDDCVIAEVGTSQFGTLGMDLPSNCEYYSQLFYSCIGFTVPATLGTLIARRELGAQGRVILFVGDGSLQMTVQEFSTIIREGLNPIIVVINNQGYTVERVIHGPAQVHNDIQNWDYQVMLRFFGAAPDQARSYSACTYEELLPILGAGEFQAGDHVRLLECFLHKYDSPALLSNLVDASIAKSTAVLQEQDRQEGRPRKELEGTLTQSGLSMQMPSAESGPGLP